MIRLATDENFNNLIIRVLRNRMPEFDLIRVQDAGLSGLKDPKILEWAANEKRILLTHDISTITHYAYDRVRKGLPMPGVVEIKCHAPVKKVVDDLVLFVYCSDIDEWDNQVAYLPLE